jgi:hypothetical protein
MSAYSKGGADAGRPGILRSVPAAHLGRLEASATSSTMLTLTVADVVRVFDPPVLVRRLADIEQPLTRNDVTWRLAVNQQTRRPSNSVPIDCSSGSPSIKTST